MFYGHKKRYWVNANGEWYKTKRSGKFIGYGKQTVTDESGKPLLILEVTTQ